jgi:ATP-binding cassette subfamily C protein/ATP-binding cassette subfamily C exporter for protease/lipase/ATP-binding cassette subfamily C protein EexD
MARANVQRRRSSDLAQAVRACRSLVWALAAFSLAINLLTLASPLYMLQVYDRVLTTGRIETLVALTALAAAALLVLGLLDAARSMVTARMGAWLNDRLGPVYLQHGVRARLVGDGAGAQPLRDLAQVQSFLASPGPMVFFDAPWTPVFLALIWLLHPMLGWIALISAAALLALSFLNEVLTRKATQAANQAQIAAFQQAETTIRNAEVVRAMGMLPALVERWRTVNRASLDAGQAATERGAVLLGLTKFARFFVQVAILGAGAHLVLKGELSSGAMIASSIILGRMLAPVELAMSTWRQFGLASLAYARLKSRLQAMPEEPDRTRLPKPLGHLAVRRATYAPAGRAGANLLQDVSFVVRPGEALAVIGPSGGGKSTLCRLLVGIAAPGEGDVRLDGTELDHYRPDELGSHVGYLPQDVELFPGTVRENIARMGDVDDAGVVRAAMLAHAHEMIQRLPQGYDTPVGEAGMRLSGGQRQRIGLARAVYGVPRLIVLDEPNANLDQAGEAALAAAVNELKAGGAALVIVGHRPSTLAQADKILLLKEGRVEMYGSRDEIVRRLRTAAANGMRSDDPVQVPAVGAEAAPRSIEGASPDRPAAEAGGPRLPRAMTS